MSGLYDSAPSFSSCPLDLFLMTLRIHLHINKKVTLLLSIPSLPFFICHFYHLGENANGQGFGDALLIIVLVLEPTILNEHIALKLLASIEQSHFGNFFFFYELGGPFGVLHLK